MKQKDGNIKVELNANNKKGVFELFVDNEKAAEMTFIFAGEDKIIIDHTEVNEEFEGSGYGKILVLKGVEFAREKGLKVIPLCPFAKIEFMKRQEYDDVLSK